MSTNVMMGRGVAISRVQTLLEVTSAGVAVDSGCILMVAPASVKCLYVINFHFKDHFKKYKDSNQT